MVHDILAGNASRGHVSWAARRTGCPKSSWESPPSSRSPPVRTRACATPVLQALVANRFGAELNILLGLCVGHDSLFLKHAQAYTTVLAV